MRSDLLDVEVIYQHQTEKAVCVRETESSSDIWIPLAVCEVDGHLQRGAVVTLTAPERVLQDKGLL